jgi:hypothetical protein
MDNRPQRVISRSRLGPAFLVGVVLLGLAGLFVTSRHPSTTITATAIMMTFCGLLLILANLSTRLIVDENSVQLAVGPWRRRVELTSLVSLELVRRAMYNRSATRYSVPAYTLRDSLGQTLQFEPAQYWRQNKEWSLLILQAADRTRATVSPQARAALEGANGTRRRHLD